MFCIHLQFSSLLYKYKKNLCAVRFDFLTEICPALHQHFFFFAKRDTSFGDTQLYPSTVSTPMLSPFLKIYGIIS